MTFKVFGAMTFGTRKRIRPRRIYF